jgi:glycosyltransferase involved in cell wall biosynthesis
VRGTLVCPEGSLVAVAAQARGIEVVPVPMSGDLDFGFVLRLRRVIRQVQPSLVHVHSRRGADRFGGLAAILAGVPAVLSRRVDRRESAWARPRYWPYKRVIAISDCIGEQLLATGLPERKLRLVNSGVLPEACAPSWSREKFLAEFGLGADDFVIAMIAQLIPRKGHRYLIDALPKIHASFRGTRVLLFGAGSQEQKLAELIERKRLGDIVQLAGHRLDLLEFLGHVQLVVHPATREGLGVSLLEAQAAGIPVVGSRVGGVTQAVSDGVTGTLVAPRDSDALAAAIIRLVWNPRDRAAMSAAARARIAEHFSADGMVQGNLAVYQEIIGGDI